MKKISKNLLIFLASQLCIGGLIVYRATQRIELSYTAEKLRHAVRNAEAATAHSEEEYYTLTATPRALSSARNRGFIPAPLATHYTLPDDSEFA